MHKSALLPWKRLLEISYGILKLTPKEFWQMSPCEWLAMLDGWKENHGIVKTAVPLNENDLANLRSQFPD